MKKLKFVQIVVLDKLDQRFIKKQFINKKIPGIAAVLSALFVGLGQIYNGEIAKGLIFMVAYFISILLSFIFIGIITTPILWIFGIYDAYNTAKKINAGEIVV